VDSAPDAILEHVLKLEHEQSGRRVQDGADKLIAAEHGATGKPQQRGWAPGSQV